MDMDPYIPPTIGEEDDGGDSIAPSDTVLGGPVKSTVCRPDIADLLFGGVVDEFLPKEFTNANVTRIDYRGTKPILQRFPTTLARNHATVDPSLLNSPNHQGMEYYWSIVIQQ